MSTVLQALLGLALGAALFTLGLQVGPTSAAIPPSALPASVSVDFSEVPSSITIRHTGLPSQVDCLNWVSAHFDKPIVSMFDAICNGSR